MTLIFHRRVQDDVAAILAHYDQAAGTSLLGDAFFDDLMAHVELARSDPTRFHFVRESVRRVNLKRFPYHFLFRISGDIVRILVVRHHSRNPSYGSQRR